MAVDWHNPKNIETLRKLMAEGYSCGQIAKQIPGATRNSIIGKASRMGFMADNAPGHAKPRAPRTPRAAPRPAPEPAIRVQGTPGRPGLTPVVARPPAEIQSNTAQQTVRLGRGSCRWPIGDPRDKDFHYCGAAVVEGRPYCPDHNVGAANQKARPFDWKKQADQAAYVDTRGAYRRY